MGTTLLRQSLTWALAIDNTHLHVAPTGMQIMITIQKWIWKYFLDTWAIRNQHLHQNAVWLDLPNYQQAAATLYKQRDRLPPAAQDALYRQPLETILDLPAPRLEQWVIRGHRYYNQQLKAIKHQAIICTQDIRTFFGPPMNPRDDLQPP